MNKDKKENLLKPKEKKARHSSQFTEEEFFLMKSKYVLDKLSNKLKDNALSEADRIWLLEELEMLEELEDAAQEPAPKKMKMSKKDKEPVEKSNRLTKEPETTKEFDDIQEMKRIFKKGNPDSEKTRVSQLMKETFGQRRTLIMSIRPMVAQVKEIYPLLFTFDEIKHELARLYPTKVYQKYHQNVVKYCHKIFDKCPESAKRDVSQYLDAAENEEKKEIIYQTGALLLISHLVGKEISYVVYAKKPGKLTEYPHIEAPSKHDALLNLKTMKVVVEGTTFCDNLTFLDAVLCMMACFYTFNIVYPESLKNTLLAIERLFLELSETKRAAGKVTKAISELKS